MPSLDSHEFSGPQPEAHLRRPDQPKLPDGKIDPEVEALLEATRLAANWSADDGLMPTKDEETGELKYTIWQGLRAACVGRQDAATSIILQAAMIKNQRMQTRLLWVIAGLCAFIAYRLG